MALRLTSLTLKRFRSVVSSELVFDNPTFLIGRNGAGKSNIVDALNFLADVVTNPLDIALDKRGGIENVRNRTGSAQGSPPNLGIRITFSGEILERRPGTVLGPDGPPKIPTEGEYAFELKAKRGGSYSILRERCVLRLSDGTKQFYDRREDRKTLSSLTFLESESWKNPVPQNYLLLPWLGVMGFAEVQTMLANIRSYAINPSELRRPQDHDLGTLLKSDGSNAGSVLQSLNKTDRLSVTQLCAMLAQITPNTADIRALRHGKQLTIEFEQSWDNNKRMKFEAFSASDGTLRALGILLALLQKPPASLLVIEEPESSLHPGALEVLLEVIQSRSQEVQILVTTHSSDLLDAKWLKPENLRLVTWHGGSDIKSVSSRAVKALRSHLTTAGDLLRSNALDEPLPGIVPIVHPDSNLFPE